MKRSPESGSTTPARAFSKVDLPLPLRPTRQVRSPRPIATLTVVSPKALERLAMATPDDSDNEYFTRPYSADSIRWRVEAMCIRRETVDDGSGPVLQGGEFGSGTWGGRATTIDGEGTHELNIAFIQYAGARASGRNGPMMVSYDSDDIDTIPPE